MASQPSIICNMCIKEGFNQPRPCAWLSWWDQFLCAEHYKVATEIIEQRFAKLRDERQEREENRPSVKLWNKLFKRK